MRWKPHVRFGGRARETYQPRGWPRALARPHSDGTTPWVKASWVRTFTVDLRLGDAGPLPREDVGPVQVNLASGDAVVKVASPTISAVGGPVGLTYTYNSQAPGPTPGLVGSYYVDTGAHTLPALPGNGAPNMVRVDPSVNFYWAGSAPAAGLPSEGFMVRWEGSVTVPSAGDYRFGAASDDGVRIYVDDALNLDRWTVHTSEPGPNYGPPITFTGTTPAQLTKSIRVEYFQNQGYSFLQLGVLPPGTSKVEDAKPVPASWLSHAVGGLPQGWTLAPAGSAYASARQSDRALTLTDASGSVVTYPWAGTGAGFTPPPSEDGVAAIDVDGKATLEAFDGRTYAFDAWGAPASVSAAVNDAAATALQYTWSTDGTPHRLLSITDPVSNRTASLTYGTTSGTDPCPRDTDFDRAPPYMLCKAVWLDGSDTKLYYKAGRLARIVDPGDVDTSAATPDHPDVGRPMTDFGYLSTPATLTVRASLQNDAIADGVVPDSTNQTTVLYDSSGRAASVTLPGPSGLQPGRSYTWDASGRKVDIKVAGLTNDPAFVARQAEWDLDPYPLASEQTGSVWTHKRLLVNGGYRTVKITQATTTPRDTTKDLVSTQVYDWGDRLVSSTDPSDRRSAAAYDAPSAGAPTSGRLNAAYGAAPSACFSPQGAYVGDPNTCRAAVTNAAYDQDPSIPTPTRGRGWLRRGGPTTASRASPRRTPARTPCRTRRPISWPLRCPPASLRRSRPASAVRSSCRRGPTRSASRSWAEPASLWTTPPWSTTAGPTTPPPRPSAGRA